MSESINIFSKILFENVLLQKLVVYSTNGIHLTHLTCSFASLTSNFYSFIIA